VRPGDAEEATQTVCAATVRLQQQIEDNETCGPVPTLHQYREHITEVTVWQYLWSKNSWAKCVVIGMDPGPTV